MVFCELARLVCNSTTTEALGEAGAAALTPPLPHTHSHTHAYASAPGWALRASARLEASMTGRVARVLGERGSG